MALLQRPRQSTQYSVVVVTLAMYTANIFTVFDCVPISTIISLRGVSGSQKNGAAAAGGAFYSAPVALGCTFNCCAKYTFFTKTSNI